ncbi:MAG TPA: site-specific integrase [Gemmataceae bacterium]|nr:site-specific integrase [Gemmataceae bacterium]
MAAIALDPASGRYRIRFYYGGVQYHRSIKTKDENKAQSILRRVDDTIQFLEQGRIVMPPDADPFTFILSDGKLTEKASVKLVRTLADLFATYQEQFTEGAKEANTRRTERIHAAHLQRLIGKTTALGTIKTGTLQEYVNARSKETWQKRPIRPQTVKKELDTLRTIWGWARRMGYVVGGAPIEGIAYPRQKEKPPFQTWAEIEAAVSRGGLSKREKRELWDALYLKKDEIDELLEYIRINGKRHWLYALFVFAAHTGARKSEMLRSHVSDFKFEQGIVIIREKKKKKGTETTRHIPLTPLLAEVMKDFFDNHHPGGPFTICREKDESLGETTAHEAFKWLFRKTKWKMLRGYHVLRHSLISLLASRGVADRVIMAIVGHLNAETTKRYTHLYPRTIQAAMALVFGEEEGPVLMGDPLVKSPEESPKTTQGQ